MVKERRKVGYIGNEYKGIYLNNKKRSIQDEGERAVYISW